MHAVLFNFENTMGYCVHLEVTSLCTVSSVFGQTHAAVDVYCTRA